MTTAAVHRPRTSPEFRRRLVDRLKVVLDVSRLLAVPDQATLLKRIGSAARELLAARQAEVLLLDAVGPETWMSGNDPAQGADHVPSRVFADDGGEVLCAPMRDLDRRIIGMVEVRDKKAGPFAPEDGLALELLAEQAALAVQRFRLLREAALGHELRREMQLAREVQAAQLPQDVRVPNVTAVGWACPASVTGGDAYDLWTLPEGRLALFVGDASGHGLAAALVISQVRSMLRALSEVSAEPDWLLSRVNARLVQDLDAGRFVTAFMATLSRDGELRWCSAGQGPVYVRPGAGADWELLEPGAMPLGVAAELDPVPAEPVQLGPGGAVLAATDGPFEARNRDGEMFGSERMLALLQDSDGGATPDQLVAAVREAVARWRGQEQPDDDETIVAATYWPG
jgi:sigma-B regulation protein RsbU (phosphoserine phosphatase)